MKYLHYRNLAEPGGPEFSEEQVKILLQILKLKMVPNSEGEMFHRPARLSDKFVVRIQMMKKQKQQMEEHIHLICQF